MSGKSSRVGEQDGTTSPRSGQRSSATRAGSTSTMSTTAPTSRSTTAASTKASIAAPSLQTSDAEADTSDPMLLHPFILRHGRRYLRNPAIGYPLPVDLTELHRQTMRTMLLVEVFGSPVCAPVFRERPPRRILEVGCGTGYWSVVCHRHYAQLGHMVSFTGLDIVRLAPKQLSQDPGMDWRFVRHDLRTRPLPFEDDTFDLIMCKDTSYVVAEGQGRQDLIDEYLRVLAPGGILECWDGDHAIRTLLPHTPADGEEDEHQERARRTGTYLMASNTPFAVAQNPYILDYNTWILIAMEKLRLTAMPCAHVQPILLQEEDLCDLTSRRVAVPLSEMHWEREGIGSDTRHDSATTSLKGKGTQLDGRRLNPHQAALRRTALLTVAAQMESLELVLRGVSGKGKDEWDRWVGNMKHDLLENRGTSWGECLELGAWWATKRGVSQKPPLKKPLMTAELATRREQRNGSGRLASASGSVEIRVPGTASSSRSLGRRRENVV